jgi:hypothetical protein
VYQIILKIIALKNYEEVTKFGFNYTDWSRKDAVIRDQNGYNSSYIFAALTAIEYRINSRKSGDNQSETWVTLSAQQIIDCCSECVATRKPETVFEYIKMNGVVAEAEYPYENSRFDLEPRKCRIDKKSGKKYFVEGYRSVKNCQALEK